MAILDAFYSAFSPLNKARGKGAGDGDNVEGVASEFLPELTLSMDDKSLIALTDKWEKKWQDSPVRSEWVKMAEDNENYWKGKQFNKLELETLRPLVDNIVFEGTETFLPAATKQNPEPLVEPAATEKKDDINLKYAEIVRNRLADWADEVKLRIKIKKAGRHWFLSLVGIVKMGWDLTNNRPACMIMRPKKVILDPEGVVNEDGYSGEFIGEYRKLKASIMIRMLQGNQKAVEYITKLVKGEMGTDVQFKEWWTNEYICWTCDKEVLLKKKNLHWNYGKEAQTLPDGTTTPAVQVNNHFASPRIPYVFLTIFNLDKTPVDETSLVTNTLPMQDLTNKRLKQIDRNADNMNNGLVVSEERSGLTKEEAKGVTQALNKGGVVVIPTGNPQEAVWRMPGIPLPSDLFSNLIDSRNRFRQILGIQGITPSGIQNEDTVRGKIIVKGLDTDRIGGGVTEYLEQFADDIYNWVVQLYYVYDDLFSQYREAKVPRLKISVKEGSMLPKDATTRANQAIELASAGKMSLIDLYKALEYPNPEEMAVNLWLEANAPEFLFKDNPLVQQALQMKAQANANAKPPSESISYKDLPPEGKAQMAAQAGIQINPEAVALHDAQNKPQQPPLPQKPGERSSELSKVPIPKQ